MRISFLTGLVSALVVFTGITLAQSEPSEGKPCHDKFRLIALWQVDPEIVHVEERSYKGRNYLIVVATDGSAGVIPEGLNGSYCKGYVMHYSDIDDFFLSGAHEKGT